MAEKEKKKVEEPTMPEAKPEEKPEAEPEEKPVEKTVKKKPRKAKKKRKGVFSYYEIEEKGLVRLRPFCERCGSGYFMADHGNRYTCGHCGFTQYKRKEADQ